MNLERYSRLTVLPSIGENGQNAIFNAKIGVFGLGGLGSWSSLLLAQMGVGFLRIVDRDVVEISNLPRTPIYTRNSVDLPKAEQAAIFLKNINPEIKIEEISDNIDANTIEDLVKGLDIVIDGLDNVSTRLIINQECKKKKIPFIFAGAIGTSANIGTFTYEESQPCLNCLFQSINDNDLETCDVLGVHSALLSLVASIQVAEAIKVITKKQPVLLNKLIYVQFDQLDFDFIPLKKRDTCPICFPTKDNKQDSKQNIIELCGDRTFLLPKKYRIGVNLTQIVEQLQAKNFRLIKQGSLGITFEYNINGSSNVIISIFSNGNMLVRGESEKNKILQISKEINNLFSDD